MPTAPGVVSTVRNKSSSLSTIFTVSRDSFSLARMALIPPGPAPNSFCVAICMSGDSGSLITSVKFLPSGHVFCVPLQSFAKSARETSESLLPAATTTAMFLIPANAPAAKSARHHKIAAIGNPLGNRSNFIGLSRFAQVSRQRSEEHTSELQSHLNLVCRLLL